MLPAEKRAIVAILFVFTVHARADEEATHVNNPVTVEKLYEHAFHPKNDTAPQSTVPRKGVVHESQLNGTSLNVPTPTPTPCKWPEKCPSTTPPARNNTSSSPSSVNVVSIRRHKPVAAVDNPSLALGAVNSSNPVLDDELPVKFPSKALPYVVGVFFSLAIVALLVVGVYKCVSGKFTRGQYRKVDFLIDGLKKTRRGRSGGALLA